MTSSPKVTLFLFLIYNFVQMSVFVHKFFPSQFCLYVKNLLSGRKHCNFQKYYTNAVVNMSVIAVFVVIYLAISALLTVLVLPSCWSCLKGPDRKCNLESWSGSESGHFMEVKVAILMLAFILLLMLWSLVHQEIPNLGLNLIYCSTILWDCWSWCCHSCIHFSKQSGDFGLQMPVVDTM